MSNDERNLIEEMHEGQREMADAARARRAAAPATSTG